MTGDGEHRAIQTAVKIESGVSSRGFHPRQTVGERQPQSALGIPMYEINGVVPQSGSSVNDLQNPAVAVGNGQSPTMGSQCHKTTGQRHGTINQAVFPEGPILYRQWINAPRINPVASVETGDNLPPTPGMRKNAGNDFAGKHFSLRSEAEGIPRHLHEPPAPFADKYRFASAVCIKEKRTRAKHMQAPAIPAEQGVVAAEIHRIVNGNGFADGFKIFERIGQQMIQRHEAPGTGGIAFHISDLIVAADK